MALTTIAGTDIQVDGEGFMVDPGEWSEEVCQGLAGNIGVELTEDHWQVIHFLRKDFEQEGVTPTLRRVTKAGGFPTKQLFTLFPKKPAKKMAYCAGLQKPVGCV